METNSIEKDFTVPISLNEKLLTAAIIALISGGILFFTRHKILADKPTLVSVNFFFAVGLFGAIRLIRLALEQKSRGLVIRKESILVESLFMKQEIPISEISDQLIICSKAPSDPNSQLTFLWGQYRFILPCRDTASLAQAIQAKGIRLLMASSDDLALKGIIEKIQNNRSNVRAKYKFPAAAGFAVSLWICGIFGLIYLS